MTPEGRLEGQVVKLDRGYPLVRAEDGALYRCEHAIALVKEHTLRAAIGDRVAIDVGEGHDKALIKEILPRTSQLVRKDPSEQALSQVLAANFDRVLVAQPLTDLNIRRLERELVLAHETGAAVSVILTKADLAATEGQQESVLGRVRGLVGTGGVSVVSTADPVSIEALRALIPPGEVAVLVGKSGVGKSSLVNLLVGHEVQKTADVRDTDGKGRHTTVSREMIEIPGGGRVVDMPGIRGLGLWDADAGIEAAFSDIEELAGACRFRDCKHEAEPGCAVCAAVRQGVLAEGRLASWRALKQETAAIQGRREEAARLRTRSGHPRTRKPPPPPEEDEGR
ncbi:MAG: ribosome small subunit-dependent GTPase A [Coriobacteriaceae bacterium]|nr:ribosome small subunit-dependent GTPase A [Coriobacteriaceae bacterium]